MRFCQDHWDRLRAKIADRGIAHLIAPDGETAVAQVKDQLERSVTPVNFDPLMHAHWAIVDNAMTTVKRAGGSPLYLMTSGPEDPVDGHEGRTWPRCPLCYINLAHEISCTDERCTLDQERGYDWMLDRAADEAKAQAERLVSAGGGDHG